MGDKISGEVSFHIQYKEVCGSDPNRPKNPVVMCSTPSETLPKKPIKVKNSQVPSDENPKAVCEVVQKARDELLGLVNGLKSERSKIKPRNTLEAIEPIENDPNFKIRRIDGQIGKLEMLLHPPKKCHSMEDKCEKGNDINQSESYAEYRVLNAKEGTYKIPLSTFWNPDAVCGIKNK